MQDASGHGDIYRARPTGPQRASPCTLAGGSIPGAQLASLPTMDLMTRIRKLLGRGKSCVFSSLWASVRVEPGAITSRTTEHLEFCFPRRLPTAGVLAKSKLPFSPHLHFTALIALIMTHHIYIIHFSEGTPGAPVEAHLRDH